MSALCQDDVARVNVCLKAQKQHTRAGAPGCLEMDPSSLQKTVCSAVLFEESSLGKHVWKSINNSNNKKSVQKVYLERVVSVITLATAIEIFRVS